jgi:hypothetical protein
MPEEISKSAVRLYIGFGGSGAKTLTAFVRNLVQHREWGSETDTHFAFMLMDTDKADLDRYAAEIQSACRQLGKDPIVRTVQTSRGVTNFQHEVAARLDRVGHHANLKRAWWYGKDPEPGSVERPFVASRLRRSPELGAGQCPPVSTFLAWTVLENIEVEIRKVVEQLSRRLTLADGNQDWTLDATLIAGLAGGTGRGCWHLLGFKIREELRKLGKETKPVGFFFDSSVFQDIMAGDPGQAIKMKVNALTGFSELTGWLRNEDAGDPYRFVLPSLDRPQDPQSNLVDVMRVVGGESDKPLPGVHGESPVSQAFVVFGGGRAGRPGQPEFYYEIVANALYSRLVGQIASGTINQESGLAGIGSASIEVPIVRIRDYVRRYIGVYLLKQQAVRIDAEKIGSWTRLLTDPLDTPNGFSYSDKSDGRLLERILSGVKAQQVRRLNDLLKCLDPKTRDYKKAAEECRKIDHWPESGPGQAAIRECALRAIVETYWGAQASPDEAGTGGFLRHLSAIQLISPEDWEILYGAGKAGSDAENPVAKALRSLLMRPSLRISFPDGTSDEIDLNGFGTRQALASKLANRLSEIAKAVPGLPAQASDPNLRCEAVFQRARKGLLKSGVDENEAGEIQQAALNAIRLRSMGAVQAAVRHCLNRAADELRIFASELGKVVRELTEEAGRLEGNLKTERDRLFWTEEDFVRAITADADFRANSSFLAEQVLQPVENDAALEQSLERMARDLSNDRFQDRRSRLVGDMRNWVERARPGDDGSERDRELRRLITRGVDELAAQLELPKSFFAEKFGFFATVRGLLGRWLDRFERSKANEPELERLKASFRIKFGMNPEVLRDRQGWIRPDDRQLDELTRKACMCMAYSLANRCDVLCEFRRVQAQGAGDGVTVVLPSEKELGKDDAGQLERNAVDDQIWREAGRFKAVSTWKDGEAGAGNPYSMLAYSQESIKDWERDEGIDRLTSIGYHLNTDLTKWLIACESQDAQSFFDLSLPLANETFGLGYIHPDFVRDERLRTRRWRPWARHDERMVTARNVFALDTVLYALLDEPSGPLGENLLRVNEAGDWSMPLLNLRGPGQPESVQERKWQFARPAFRDSLGRITADHPAIKAGEGYTSIRKLFDALEQHPAKVEAIAAEAAIYLKDRLPGHDDEGVSADGAVREMFRNLKVRLETAKEAETGHTMEEYRKLLDQLLARVERLGGMTCAQLEDHFRRRGKD